MHADTLIFLGQGVKVLLEQDVLGGDVGKDKVNLGDVSVGPAPDDGADNLQHGRDTSSTGNHTKVFAHVLLVHEGALGPAHANRLANHEGGHVLGDVALRVGLDEEVEVSRLVVAGDGGVGADDFLGAAVGLGKRGADGDVLADGESENGVARGKLEPVAASMLAKRRRRHNVRGRGRDLHGDIVGNDSLLLELELLEYIRLEDLLDACSLSSDIRSRGGGARLLTNPVQVPRREGNGEQSGVDGPLLLDHDGAADEQRSGHVDIVALEDEDVLIPVHERHVGGAEGEAITGESLVASSLSRGWFRVSGGSRLWPGRIFPHHWHYRGRWKPNVGGEGVRGSGQARKTSGMSKSAMPTRYGAAKTVCPSFAQGDVLDD